VLRLPPSSKILINGLITPRSFAKNEGKAIFSSEVKSVKPLNKLNELHEERGSWVPFVIRLVAGKSCTENSDELLGIVVIKVWAGVSTLGFERANDLDC
jgi:hypothetical protein